MDAPDVAIALFEYYFHTPSSWWSDGRIGRAMAEALVAADLWLDFRYHGQWGAKRPGRIRSSAELEALSRKWNGNTLVLQCEPEVDQSGSSLRISTRQGLLGLTFRITDAELTARQATLVEAFDEFGVRMHGVLHPSAVLATGGLTMYGGGFPRRRPPRASAAPFSLGMILDFYDLAYLRQHRPPTDSDVATSAPLPAGARRRREGDLVVIRWIDRFADVGAIQAARARQAEWIASQVELEIEPDYNERGDLKERPYQLVEHAPLTFFDPTRAVGYKALAANSRGEVDAEQWAEIAEWARSRKLPDGTALAQLGIITPAREAALALLERARAAGVDTVLYIDNKNRWWNPSPPGPWLAAT